MAQKIVRWRSNYRGEARFDVVAGPLAGETVAVRFLKPDFYEKDFRDNAGGAFLPDWGVYTREVMSSVGIVRSTLHPAGLPTEVVEAVNADFEDLRASSDPGIFFGSFLNGRYDPQVGWVAH
ncbi:hypothetical protein GA566_30905 [Cupriavidus sp. SW-Y-13]|nr:hypothetical protein [Cupriavidus sp. SW-Y-13]